MVVPERLLIKGDEGKEVEWVQEKLWRLGCVAADNPFWTSRWAIKNGITSPDHPDAKEGWIDGDFGGWTENGIIFMQQRFLGERGIPLDEISKSGVVGRNVLFALENSEGPAQDQQVDPQISDIAPEIGVMVIKVWNHYIAIGIHETRGNNRGKRLPVSPWAEGKGVKDGGIDAWINYNSNRPNVKGPSWCMFSRCCIEKEAYSAIHGEPEYFQSGKREGLCYNNYKWGKAQDEPKAIKEYMESMDEIPKLDYPSIFRGWIVDKEHVISGAIKLPTGAAGIMNYGGISGHTFSVADVIYDNKGRATHIVNCEGNISNSAGWRRRDLRQSSIKWFLISPLLLDTADYIGVSKDDVKLSSGTERTT